MPVRVLDERSVFNAIQKRSAYIADNASTLSMKALRKLLEEDLQVPKDTLKSFKEEIEDRALKIVQNGGQGEQSNDEEADSDEENRPQAKPGSDGKASKRDRKPQADDSKQRKKAKKDDKPKPREKKPTAKVEKVKEAKPKKKQQAPPPVKSTGAKEHSQKVKKLQAICKRATITIGPSIYRGGNDTEIAERLRALLDKHDLNEQSGEREISKAKANLQTNRDLDGIDSGNIVTGGRSSRRAAAPAVDYAAIMNNRGSSLESESAANSESGNEEQSGGSDAEPRNKKAGSKRKTLMDESSSGGEEYQAEDDVAEEEAGSGQYMQASASDKNASEDDTPEVAERKPASTGSPAKRKRAAVMDGSDSEPNSEDDKDRDASKAAPGAIPAADSSHAAKQQEPEEKLSSKLESAGRDGGHSSPDLSTHQQRQQAGAQAEKEETQKAEQQVDRAGQGKRSEAELHEDSSSDEAIAAKRAPKRRTVLDEDSDEEE